MWLQSWLWKKKNSSCRPDIHPCLSAQEVEVCLLSPRTPSAANWGAPTPSHAGYLCKPLSSELQLSEPTGMLKVSFVPFITSPILLVIIWAPGTLRSHTPQEHFSASWFWSKKHCNDDPTLHLHLQGYCYSNPTSILRSGTCYSLQLLLVVLMLHQRLPW